jgi:hypothetical protein
MDELLVARDQFPVTLGNPWQMVWGAGGATIAVGNLLITWLGYYM